MPKVARVQQWDPVRGDTAELRPPSQLAHHYYAFLSYSHRDEATAKWLHEELERFRVPPSLAGKLTDNGVVPKRLTPIFRDSGELAAADDLGAEIRQALAASRFLVVLCSPAAAESRWTNAEIEAFKRVRPEGCILAAIVEGEPFASELPGRETEECLPPALRFKYDRRGRRTERKAEPLAADLRGDRDSRRLGFLKIVAGMLGVRLDELVQRETLRRQRRLAILAAASLAGMVVTSSLAVVAIQSRDEARDQRRQAEGLVGFMLGDLRDKLEPLGRLDVLDSVGARALAYFESQDKTRLSDEALAQRSRALTLMGEIANSRGDLSGALKRYQEAFESTEELLKRSPDDPVRAFDHAQNVFWVGQIAWQRGQTPQAERSIREYLRLAEHMMALDPGNEKYQLERKYATTSLGAILIDLRRYPEAVTMFRGSLADAESLVAASPDNADYQQSRLEALAWLSEALEDVGRLDDALAQRERQLSFLGPLIRARESDPNYRVQAMAAHRAAGRLLASRGDLAGGLTHLRESVRIGEGLMRTEPDNADWAGLAAEPYLDLAGLQLAARQTNDAGVSTRAGCDIADRLLLRDSSVKEWRLSKGDCLTLRTRLALARGANEEARAVSGQLIAWSAAESRKSRNADTQQRVAEAEMIRGLVEAQSGDRNAARAAFHSALKAWPKNAVLTPPAMSTEALILAGSAGKDAAANRAMKLKAIGYRHPIYLQDWQTIIGS